MRYLGFFLIVIGVWMIMYSTEPKASNTLILALLEVSNHEYTIETVDRVAREEGLDPFMMKSVANCESRFDTQAHNTDDPHGGAIGLYQIILVWHPIGEDCARDAECSTEYFAQREKEGDGSLWTCYRTYYE